MTRHFPELEHRAVPRAEDFLFSPIASLLALKRLPAKFMALQSSFDGLIEERQRVITRYLDLMENCISGSIYQDPPLQALGQTNYDDNLREYGWDWPSVAHSMIGRKRLNNVRLLAESVLGNGIEGDFIETGVWRGGACILLRAVLEGYRVRDRRVWVADSFEGLPPPDPDKYPADDGDSFHTYTELSVSLDDVRRNFSRYGLLDEQVVFLKGWFEDTLKDAPIEKLALLRLDGDMYGSTIVALESLYDRLSLGGYVIVDDYHVVTGCRKAVEDFFAARNHFPTLEEIDGVGVFWKKDRA